MRNHRLTGFGTLARNSRLKPRDRRSMIQTGLQTEQRYWRLAMRPIRQAINAGGPSCPYGAGWLPRCHRRFTLLNRSRRGRNWSSFLLITARQSSRRCRASVISNLSSARPSRESGKPGQGLDNV